MSYYPNGTTANPTWVNPNWVYTPTITTYPQQWPYSVSGGNYPKPNQNNLLKVTGPESAKSYPLGPNSSVVLFDANEAVFYLKTTDDSGFASLRTFDFSERQPDVIDVNPAETKDFATKEDLDELSKKLADISETLKGLI